MNPKPESQNPQNNSLLQLGQEHARPRRRWESISTGNLGLGSEMRVRGQGRSILGHLGSLLALGDLARLTGRSGFREVAQETQMERIRHRNRKRQREEAMENRAGRLVTRAQPRPLLSQTPAAPSPAFPGVPGPPLANPAPASPSCSLRTKTPGYELIQHSCHNGEKSGPSPLSFLL